MWIVLEIKFELSQIKLVLRVGILTNFNYPKYRHKV